MRMKPYRRNICKKKVVAWFIYSIPIIAGDLMSEIIEAVKAIRKWDYIDRIVTVKDTPRHKKVIVTAMNVDDFTEELIIEWKDGVVEVYYCEE